MPDVTVAFQGQVWSGRNIFYFLTSGVIGASSIPDGPDGRIRGTHPPKSRALHTQAFAGAKLVVGSDGVQYPDPVNVILLVGVGVVRIQRSLVELDVGFGLVSVQQRFLNAELRTGPRSLPSGLAPVVGVVGDTNDNFLRGYDFQNLAQIFDKPVLCGDGTGRRGQPVLVVVHEDDGVALFA